MDEEGTRRRRVEVFVEASLDEETWMELQGLTEEFVTTLMETYNLKELRYRFEHILRDEKTGRVYA